MNLTFEEATALSVINDHKPVVVHHQSQLLVAIDGIAIPIAAVFYLLGERLSAAPEYPERDQHITLLQNSICKTSSISVNLNTARTAVHIMVDNCKTKSNPVAALLQLIEIFDNDYAELLADDIPEETLEPTKYFICATLISSLKTRVHRFIAAITKPNTQ